MTTALTAAAKRLITLPGFRWMPGMVDTEGRRFVGDTETAEPLSIFVEWLVDVARGGERAPYALPDLTDPATLGCVLAMVREAYGDPGVGAVLSTSLAEGEPTWWLIWAGDQLFDAATEGEVLVNALAAAGAK
jgi:hypothetical protein